MWIYIRSSHVFDGSDAFSFIFMSFDSRVQRKSVVISICKLGGRRDERMTVCCIGFE